MESQLEKQPSIPERLIDEARLLSVATGKLYDIQVLNLKVIPLVVFGDDLTNEFCINFDKKTIHFDLNGKTDYPKNEEKDRIKNLIQYVKRLIGDFEVTIAINQKALNGSDSKNTGKSRKPAKPRGKKRLRKVRKGQ